MSAPYTPDQPTTPLPDVQAAQPYPAAPLPEPYAAAPAPSTATTLGATNTFALLAIVFAFIAPLAGIIFGHMGLSQIKRNGDAGRGIALTGLIISYAYFVLVALIVVAYVGVIFMIVGTMGAVLGEVGSSGSPYGY